MGTGELYTMKISGRSPHNETEKLFFQQEDGGLFFMKSVDSFGGFACRTAVLFKLSGDAVDSPACGAGLKAQIVRFALGFAPVAGLPALD